MSAKRRRISKKAYERLERQMADRKSKAPAESKNRQEKIKVRWGIDEQQLKATTKNPKEKQQKEQELKEQKLKELLSSVRESVEDANVVDQVAELVELAGLQDREIEYPNQFRRDWEEIDAHYPERLENLSFMSFRAAWEPLFETLAEEKPKKAWERKRGRYRWIGAGVGLIEYEFGGDGEAKWRKSSLSGLSHLPYQPSCLDHILRGGVGEVKMQPSFWGPPIAVDTVTNMRRLQFLFGIHRDRFPKKLRGRSMGKMIVYDWQALVKIMDALLSEPRKRAVRGRPRTLWLSDPDLRNRVLSGIEARINSISAPKEIATAFLDLVHRHRVDSAKK
jgi:hypothetical protein